MEITTTSEGSRRPDASARPCFQYHPITTANSNICSTSRSLVSRFAWITIKNAIPFGHRQPNLRLHPSLNPFSSTFQTILATCPTSVGQNWRRVDHAQIPTCNKGVMSQNPAPNHRNDFPVFFLIPTACSARYLALSVSRRVQSEQKQVANGQNPLYATITAVCAKNKQHLINPTSPSTNPATWRPWKWAETPLGKSTVERQGPNLCLRELQKYMVM